MKTMGLFLLTLFVLLLSACGQGGDSPTQGEEGNDSVTNSAWSFETKTTHDENELLVQMTVTNQQETKSTLDFASGQLYEMVLTDSNGEEVYRFSEGRMFSMAIVQEAFEAGESKTFEEVIALDKLDKGTYTLDVQLVVMAVDNEEWTDEETFQNRLDVIID